MNLQIVSGEVFERFERPERTEQRYLAPVPRTELNELVVDPIMQVN